MKSPSRFEELADFLVGKKVRVECSDAKGREWSHVGDVVGCHPEAITIDPGISWPITIVPWGFIESVKVVDRGS